MKVRTDFVTNSSSSSYITVRLGAEILVDDAEESAIIEVEDLIKRLEKAKKFGIKYLEIESWGTYDG